MGDNVFSKQFEIEYSDNKRLINLCGKFDENIKQIEKSLDIKIYNRGNVFTLRGDKNNVNIANDVLTYLYAATARNSCLVASDVHMSLTQFKHPGMAEQKKQKKVKIKANLRQVEARSPNQVDYIKNIREYDINFGIGPAGTGKTYIAVACAVEALEHDEVKRIVLVRPAVEAGEKLGFLPGDLTQKIDPYLRPLYDALYEMLGFEKVNLLIERNTIEIAPLAYMRGRTLNDSFIILDESQNTTCEQMKMFLTRIGFGSKAVITGDTTQIDLPHGKKSGLKEAIEILSDTPKIKLNYFGSKDVVRHPLVQAVIEAYNKHEEQKALDKKKAVLESKEKLEKV